MKEYILKEKIKIKVLTGSIFDVDCDAMAISVGLGNHHKTCFLVPTNNRSIKHVIHSITPYFDQHQKNFEKEIVNTFKNILTLANENNIKKITLPLLGTGVIGAPGDLVALKFKEALLNFIETESHLIIEEICCINIDDMNTYYIINELETSLNNTDLKPADEIGILDNFQSSLNLNDKDKHEASNNNDETNSNLSTLKTCEICSNDQLDAKDMVKLKNCAHELCKSCFKQNTEINPKCPFCQKYYAMPHGTQPKNGRMTHTILAQSLPGYDNCRTIMISYKIPPGIQEAHHPTPGKPYNGINRDAYLPDNKEGNKVLALLKKAFEHRLVFTIGESRTLGISGVITWNDIHHKTSTHGTYGYPDKDYLERVTGELKAFGIE